MSPLPIRPEDIQNKTFKVVTGLRKGGYDEVEVDTFLDEIEVELRNLLEENASLRQRLEAAMNAPAPAPVASEAEEMLRRTLVLAQRTADETVAAAQADAERMTHEARQTAHALLESARAESAAATVDLERRRQALEQHIEGLRAFEREYRTRLKAYLESQLRDLDGRGAPAEALAAAPPAVPPAVPPAPPAPPAVAAPPAPPAVAAPPPSVPDDAPPAQEHPQMAPGAAFGEPEPFDIDEGGTGVPRLAP